MRQPEKGCAGLIGPVLARVANGLQKREGGQLPISGADMRAANSITVQGRQAVANRSDLDQLGSTVLARQAGENGFAKHRVHGARPCKRGINPLEGPPVPPRSVRKTSCDERPSAG